MSRKSESYWKDGLSIDETKFSVLVLAFIVGYIVLMYLCIKNNDTNTVERIIIFITSAITGLNITKAVTDRKNPKG